MFSYLVDIALFLATFFLVGKCPTVRKVAGMVCLVALAQIAVDSILAAQAGSTIYATYLSNWDTLSQVYSNYVDASQMEQFYSLYKVMSGCWVANYFMQAFFEVSVLLVIMWLVKRVRKTLDWAPFSKADLSIVAVLPLALGCLLLALSRIPGMPEQHMVYLVALNVLIISVMPLFAQGAVAAKGVMNRKLPMAWQVVIVIMATLLGAIFIVLPIIGLIDFWANFRKLPRGNKAEQSEES